MCNTARKHGLLKIEAYMTYIYDFFFFWSQLKFLILVPPKTIGINRKHDTGSYQWLHEDYIFVGNLKLVQTVRFGLLQNCKIWFIKKNIFKVAHIISFVDKYRGQYLQP